ncbi:MAG: TlpA family protein disulfide reductase [Deltaproteobacteria bacterium]|nr:TlpA family protein disulfide reductase [Deltaproteobacteria bacterium]
MKKVLCILALSLSLLPSFAVMAGSSAWQAMGIERLRPVAAPDFTLKDLKTHSLHLKDFRGKVVLLNFWATWCAPCKSEMPSMERLMRQFSGKDFEVIAINLAEDEKTVAAFVKENGYTFRILLDKKGSVSDRYGAAAIPATYIINGEGMIIGRVIGARDWASSSSFDVFKELLKK